VNDEPTTRSNDSLPPRGEALGILAITFFAFLVVGLVGEGTLGKEQILLGEALVIAPAYLYARLRNYETKAVFRLHTVRFRVVAVSAVIGLSMTVVADELDRLMNLILPFPEELAEMLKQILVARTASDWLIVLFGAVLIAGLFEEMLFRGFLQNSFERYGDVTSAVLWSAVLFAGFHVNPWWLAQIVLLGVILGVMAWKSNSIFPGAIVHAINNGISVAVINLPENELDVLEWHGHVHPVLILAALAALVFSLRLFYRYCENPADEPSRDQFHFRV
jgi:membrane protease YdiL (CAAX protease family)